MLIDRPVGRARCSDGPAPGGGVGRGAYPWSAILYITPSLRHSTISPPGELCHLVFKFLLASGHGRVMYLDLAFVRPRPGLESWFFLGLRPATTGSCILGLRTSGHGRVWYRGVAPRSALAGTRRGSFPSFLLLTCLFRPSRAGGYAGGSHSMPGSRLTWYRPPIRSTR